MIPLNTTTTTQALHSLSPTTLAGKVSVAIGVLLLCVTLIQFLDFPVLNHGLIAFSIIYLFALILFPRAWLIVLPLFVVSVDLTTWSGRFLFNELDLVFITTISYQLIGRQFSQKLSAIGMILTALYILLYLSQSLSGLMGGVSEIIGPAFSNPYYHDGYAYKVAKGVIWGALLALMYAKQHQENKELTNQYTMAGASLAGIALFIVILWERGTIGTIFQGGPWWAIPSSLLDFTSSYRTTGIFSDMHTGGEAVDGMILLLIPFTLYGLTHSHHLLMRLLSLAGFSGLAYVTLVGFTRATYMAVAIAGILYFAFGVKHQTHLGKSKVLVAYSGYLLIIVLSAVLSHYVGHAHAVVAYTITIATGAVVSFIYSRSLQPPKPMVFLIAGLVVTSIVAYFAVGAHLSNRWITADSNGTAWTVLSVVLLFGISVASFHYARPVTNTSRITAPLVLIAVSAVISFASGGYKINERMNDVAKDMNTRMTHWHNVIESGSDSAMSIAFGNGVGSFPRNNLLTFSSTVAEVGSFTVIQTKTANSLRLGPGWDLSFGQRVQIQPNTNYTMTLTYESEEDTSLDIFICERNLIFASNFMANCSSVSRKLPAATEQPATAQIDLNSKNVGKKSILARWPTLIYIKNYKFGRPINLTNIALTEGPPTNEHTNWPLLQNSDFSQGMDHWFFYNDFSHLPWHIKNTLVQAYYDTGIAGLFLLVLLLMYAMIISIKERINDPFIVALVLGPLSLVIFGMFGTPLDSARVSGLFYMMLFATVLASRDNRSRP